LYRVSRLQGGQECTIRATAELTRTTTRQVWTRPPIDVDFQVLMLTASGLIVRFLKVFEKSNYQSIKWVRYLTKASGNYQIRVRTHKPIWLPNIHICNSSETRFWFRDISCSVLDIFSNMPLMNFVLVFISRETIDNVPSRLTSSCLRKYTHQCVITQFELWFHLLVLATILSLPLSVNRRPWPAQGTSEPHVLEVFCVLSPSVWLLTCYVQPTDLGSTMDRQSTACSIRETCRWKPYWMKMTFCRNAKHRIHDSLITSVGKVSCKPCWVMWLVKLKARRKAGSSE